MWNNEIVLETCTTCDALRDLCNLKNMKNTRGGVLLFQKMRASALSFTTSIASPCVFSCFLKCTNCKKLRKVEAYMDCFIQTHFHRIKI